MQIDDRDVIQLPFIQVNKDAPKVLVQEEAIMQLTNPKNNSGDGAGPSASQKLTIHQAAPLLSSCLCNVCSGQYVVSKTVEKDYKKKKVHPIIVEATPRLPRRGPWTATFLASSRPVQFYKFNQ